MEAEKVNGDRKDRKAKGRNPKQSRGKVVRKRQVGDRKWRYRHEEKISRVLRGYKRSRRGVMKIYRDIGGGGER